MRRKFCLRVVKKVNFNPGQLQYRNITKLYGSEITVALLEVLWGFPQESVSVH